ncbi:hypothetical protein L208DRAFT_1379838 [Tricholoma matsutake]|nr:hypothetical protein L208DRAFT_1379838 [Tricholoma matsutake 945]
MGVPGLWKILLPAAQRCSLTEVVAVEGFEQDCRRMQTMILGIDASIWMKKAQAKFYHPKHAQAGENPKLQVLFYRLCYVLCHPITPIFIFNGPEWLAFKHNRLVVPQPHWLTELFQAFIVVFSPTTVAIGTFWIPHLMVWPIELSTDKSGFLGQHFSILAYAVHDDFPNINIIYQYARPATSWSNGQNGPDMSAWLLQQPHLSELAALCEHTFSWGLLAVTSIFCNNVWEGCCVQRLAQITEVFTLHILQQHINGSVIDDGPPSLSSFPQIRKILKRALPMLVQQFKGRVPPIFPLMLSSTDTSKPVPKVHYEESPCKYSIPAEQVVINLTVGMKHLEDHVELSGDSDFIDLTLSD